MIRILSTTGLIIALAATLACAPRAMRGGAGTENPNMDRAAMCTTLDRDDISYLVDQNLDALFDSGFWKNQVSVARKPPIMAIWPIENATSEHLEDQMLTLLSSIETSLINSGLVQVVAKSRQEALAREIGIQQGAIYDPSSAARLGKQLGAQYFVTGKLTAVDERLQKTRRLPDRYVHGEGVSGGAPSDVTDPYLPQNAFRSLHCEVI